MPFVAPMPSKFDIETICFRPIIHSNPKISEMLYLLSPLFWMYFPEPLVWYLLVWLAFIGASSNTLAESTYKKMMKYGLGIGMPLSSLGLILLYTNGWEWKYAQFIGRIPNSVATIGIAFGYIAMIMLWIKKDYATSIQQRLRAVGKVALIAYILQSVIATSILWIWFGFLWSVSRLGR